MADIDTDAAPAAIAQARAAGHSDQDIYNYLAQQAPDQFAAAAKTGRSPTEILNYLAGTPTGAQSQQTTGPQPSGSQQPTSQQSAIPMSWGNVAGQALVNAPGSAGRLLMDIAQPIIHPSQTAESFKDIGLGLLEKTGLKAPAGHEQYANALGQYFVNRYGGMENFKRSLATDPVGVLADVSTVLTGGETALARVPGAIGRAAEIAGTAGRAIDPLSRMGEVAGKVAEHSLGVSTGVGSTPLRTAYEAGQQGGAAGQALRNYMAGQGNARDIVDEARNAVGQLRQQRGIEYNAGMTPIRGDAEVLDWGDIDRAMDQMRKIQTYKGRVNPDVLPTRQKLEDVVNAWKSLPVADYHTPEGFDAMKQEIGTTLAATEPGSPQHLMANTVYNSIRDTIARQAQGYSDVMKNYQRATDLIKEMESSLTGKSTTPIDTSLRKLQSVMRNNVQTNYGRRTNLAQMLAANGAPNLMNKLAGMSLSAWAPRGIARVGASIEQALPALAGVSHGGVMAGALGMAKAFPFLALTSPRLMGEAAYGTGVASRYAPLATLPGRITRPLTEAEREQGR